MTGQVITLILIYDSRLKYVPLLMVNIVYQHKKNDNNNFNNYSSLIIFKLQTLNGIFWLTYFCLNINLKKILSRDWCGRFPSSGCT